MIQTVKLSESSRQPWHYCSVFVPIKKFTKRVNKIYTLYDHLPLLECLLANVIRLFSIRFGCDRSVTSDSICECHPKTDLKYPLTSEHRPTCVSPMLLSTAMTRIWYRQGLWSLCFVFLILRKRWHHRSSFIPVCLLVFEKEQIQFMHTSLHSIL